MSKLSERLFAMQSWRDNYMRETELRRDAAMLREIGWMLLEALAVTAFLASFR
jgi:hypothetical protein